MSKEPKASTATVERFAAIAALIAKFQAELPQDAARIEIDVEYTDGGRVKLEGRS